MTKNISSALILGILVTALGVGYYFGFYLPKAQQKQQLFDNQIKCRNLVQAEYEKEEKGTTGSSIFLPPESKFIPEENKCIYKGIFQEGTQGEGFLYNYFIKDMITNQSLASWSINTKDNNLTKTSQEQQYDNVNAKYFSN